MEDLGKRDQLTMTTGAFWQRQKISDILKS